MGRMKDFHRICRGIGHSIGAIVSRSQGAACSLVLPALVIASLTTLTMSTVTADSYTNATNYLLKQQTKAGCENSKGRFDHTGVYEVDLNGDNKLDLVLSHQGLSCQGEMAMSSFCGAQFCTILVYYREGKLLKKRDEFLGYILSFRGSPEPVFDIAEINGTVTHWTPRRQSSR